MKATWFYKTVTVMMVVIMTMLCFTGCGKTKDEKEVIEQLVTEIKQATCTTPEEFADLMIHIRDELRWFEDDPFYELFYDDYSTPGTTITGRFYDITVALQENKDVMKYLNAPYTDRIPDFLHSYDKGIMGLSADEIWLLYVYVANDYGIDYYAVRGLYPLAYYAAPQETRMPSEDKIIEELKSSVKFRNPESLQIHDIRYYRKNDDLFSSEVTDKRWASPMIGIILVDYSAQNGYGGYDRKIARLNMYAASSGTMVMLDSADADRPDGYQEANFYILDHWTNEWSWSIING